MLQYVRTEAAISISYYAHTFPVRLCVLVEAVDMTSVKSLVVNAQWREVEGWNDSQYWNRIRSLTRILTFMISDTFRTWAQHNIQQHPRSQRLGICAECFMIQMFSAGNHFNTWGFFWTTGHCKFLQLSQPARERENICCHQPHWLNIAIYFKTYWYHLEI